MDFQFGMNWSYYSHYVGDIFGAPLAIEGLMAFFLEATFVGLMFFGWDKLKPHAHLFVTFMVALGTNLSALWILIANGWMQNPVGAAFNPDSSGWRSRTSCRAVQPGGPGQFVIPSARVTSAPRSSCWAFGLLSAAGQARWFRQAFDDGGLRPSAWRRRCPLSCWATSPAMP